MDRFEEGLEVITRLVRSEELVGFKGRYFHLEGARLLPRPQQATRILIGGKGLKRTLPLAARFADIWNCLPASPEQFKELSNHLDGLLTSDGRDPSEVKRSLLLPILCYNTLEERHAAFDRARMLPVISTLTDEDLLAWFDPTAFLQGSPAEIAQQVHAYAQAGVEELVLQWLWVNDFLGLELLGKELLPLLT
jgi:alkanesulfonate monooxygenase SsuD/methylene tetrahydromethanopterin reductase-like flavin-dependent oxidoreductase (luciferase family)